MVEAARIAPDLEHDTSTALTALIADTNYSVAEACDDLILTIAAQLEQNDDSLLRSVCESYANRLRSHVES